MARSRPNEVLPYKHFSVYLKELIAAWEKARDSERFVQTQVQEVMGIHSSSISKFVRGSHRPTPQQCLRIARFFDRSLEDILRAAWYPDVAELAKLVEADATPRLNELEKQYILDMLQIAQMSVAWQDLRWKRSPYKERAEKALASDDDAYEKASQYADAVYEWYHSREWDAPRWQRKTQDMLPVTS